MKTISTLILVFAITFAKAQTNPATPNANFEDWTHVAANGGYDDPDGWNCLNPYTAPPPIGIVTCFKDSSTFISGKYSILLVTMTAFSQTIPGTATTGTINASQQTISGGIPYTLHPDSIIGWYQYTSVSGDNGDIEFYLFGPPNHTDTIGMAFFKTPASNVHTWTRFSLPVTYKGSGAPDTSLWILTSSVNQTLGHPGSQLILDSLGLVFNISGINKLTASENITVGPNPSNGLISIVNRSNTSSAIFTLYDIIGRKVEENNITKGTSYMELTQVPSGIYLYSIEDQNSSVIKTGKLIIQK